MIDHKAYPGHSYQFDADSVARCLDAIGVAYIYGGGPDSKGHGFWLQYNGKTIHNDGISSGNPCFWMADEAHDFAFEADYAARISTDGYTRGLAEFLNRSRPYPDKRTTGETPMNAQAAKCQTYGWSCLAHSVLTLKRGRVVDAVRDEVRLWCGPTDISEEKLAIY